MSDFADFAVWLSNRPNLRFSSVLVTPTWWTFAITLLDPKLPHLNLARLPADDAGALVLCAGFPGRVHAFGRDVYECMELFKTFELQRPTRSTPLPYAHGTEGYLD
ncbi:hypothetical protein BDZ89DRAFT_1133176 [Hymenopellis radicata]|nr:hypothetical protein BDZ89DRAFT_1133176 [Hymenopellis radicata]